MGWTLARSLGRLRDQVNEVAPSRNKASDGTIGDEAHQKRGSDHNPDSADVVRAIDITDDPGGGLSAEALAESLRASRDPRIKYVIWNEQIFSSYSNSKRTAWEWGTSKGHIRHVHVSIQGSALAESDTSSWSITAQTGAAPVVGPDFRGGDYGLQPFDKNKQLLQRDSPDIGQKVRYLQGVLKNEAGEELDISGGGYGRFGPQTERAVKNVQSRFGVTVTGVVDWDGPDGNSPGSNATWPTSTTSPSKHKQSRQPPPRRRPRPRVVLAW